MTRMLQLRLFGPFGCRMEGVSNDLNIASAKSRALIAMLALAPDGCHSRNWLRETLWSRVEKEQGADSLRQAIGGLKRVFGDDFARYFTVDRTEIRLNSDHVKIEKPSAGALLLEGLDVPEAPLLQWLERARAAASRGELLGDLPVDGRLRPRIAIVPFLSRANREDERHLSDLVAQEITRILSRNPSFVVISHLSSRRLAIRQLDIATVREQLGVDYLVTGTLGSDGQQLRLDADFIEIESGRVAWSERIDAPVAALLAGSDTPMLDVAHRVGAGVLRASVELARSQPLPSTESHALFMAAIVQLHQHRVHTFSQARQMLEILSDRHPGHATVKAWLGMWYLLRMAQAMSRDPAADLAQARAWTAQALEADANCAMSLTVDGMAHSDGVQGFGKAESRFDNALQLDPNNALAHLMLSRLHSFFGNGPAAVASAERATTLSPLDPNHYFFEVMRATAYLVDGQYSRARRIAERSVAANPRHTSSLRCLIVAAQKMGDTARAGSALEALRRREPKLTVSSYLKGHPAAQLATGQDWAMALRAAGLPE